MGEEARGGEGRTRRVAHYYTLVPKHVHDSRGHRMVVEKGEAMTGGQYTCTNNTRTATNQHTQ